jgi:hypothetical protein
LPGDGEALGDEPFVGKNFVVADANSFRRRDYDLSTLFAKAFPSSGIGRELGVDRGHDQMNLFLLTDLLNFRNKLRVGTPGYEIEIVRELHGSGIRRGVDGDDPARNPQLCQAFPEAVHETHAAASRRYEDVHVHVRLSSASLVVSSAQYVIDSQAEALNWHAAS